MISKKRLTLLAAGAASAAAIATLVPVTASAETNQRLCGGKVTEPNGKAVAYVVAKVERNDSAACDVAINTKAPELLQRQISTGGIPDPERDNSTSNVSMATCEDVFGDLGFPPGTDQCPGIVGSKAEDVSVVLISRPNPSP